MCRGEPFTIIIHVSENVSISPSLCRIVSNSFLYLFFSIILLTKARCWSGRVWVRSVSLSNREYEGLYVCPDIHGRNDPYPLLDYHHGQILSLVHRVEALVFCICIVCAVISSVPHSETTGLADPAVRFPTPSKSSAIHVAALASSFEGTIAPASTIPTTTGARIPELCG